MEECVCVMVNGLCSGATQGIFTQVGLQQQNQPTAQQELLNTQLLISAISMPALFQDERDVIIKKFNQLEAYCGTGKGLTSHAGQAQHVEFQPNNPFARFKAS